MAADIRKTKTYQAENHRKRHYVSGNEDDEINYNDNNDITAPNNNHYNNMDSGNDINDDINNYYNANS